MTTYQLFVNGNAFVYGSRGTVEREAEALRAEGKTVSVERIVVTNDIRDEVLSDLYLYG